jgi:hypothetical protein
VLASKQSGDESKDAFPASKHVGNGSEHDRAAQTRCPGLLAAPALSQSIYGRARGLGAGRVLRSHWL